MQRLISLLRFCLLLAVIAAAVAVTSRWWMPVRVAGGSMLPALHHGDLAVVRVGAGPRVGDVVLISQPGRGLVLHRVTALEGSTAVRTKGDANPTPDVDPVELRHVKGTVATVVPVGGWLARWRERAGYATLAAHDR